LRDPQKDRRAEIKGQGNAKDENQKKEIRNQVPLRKEGGKEMKQRQKYKGTQNSTWGGREKKID